MILLFKEKFPFAFSVIRKIYRSTPFYRNKILKISIAIERENKIKIQKDKEIIKNIFLDQYMVCNGPFKNLKYIDSSSGSTFLPKILGSYEEPIQVWVEEIINKNKYSKILDIGCAEGYYACGLAMLLPKVEIIAYDIDDQAKLNTRRMAELNGIKNLEIRSNCDYQELNNNINESTLIFCDIEGYEDVLLNPIKAPNLSKADLLVEAHDVFVKGISDLLIDRFLNTHKIRILVDYPFRLKKYYTPLPVDKTTFDYITDEVRPRGMKFLFMESIYGKV